jgi:hypothetical protein
LGTANILFSTTRGWNSGDEFILFGVRRVLDDLGIDYNPVIFNRHPSITPKKYTAKRPFFPAKAAPHLDNSHSLEGFSGIDYVVFAGSPEWVGGPRNEALQKFILDNNLRCAFIGMGLAGPRTIGEKLDRILKERTDVFFARDAACYDLVKQYPNTHYQVCPSIFSVRNPVLRTVTGEKKVGLVIQTDKTPHQRISAELEAYCYEQYEKLNKKFATTLIAHYIDEFKAARSRGYDVAYSSYSEDYTDIFRRFDVVISTRVHGCGMCTSMAIPNAMIPHDKRSDTVTKFRSYVAQPGEDLTDWVENLDVAATSQSMLDYRQEMHDVYMGLLKGKLSVQS